MKYFFILVTLMSFSLQAFAQDSTKRLLRNTSFVALPVLFRLPETRFGGGVAGAAVFGFAKDSIVAKPSQISFGATFTQNKQILFFFPFKIFTHNNKYYFSSENGWFRYKYTYAGVGENRVTDESYSADM